MAFDLKEGDFDAIIFDCDGTLVDTAPVHLQGLQDALATRGLSMDAEWYFPRVGLTPDKLFDEYESQIATLPMSRAERAVAEAGALAPCIVVSLPYDPDLAVPQYYWDEADGARDIAAHLAERGHGAAAILAGGRTDASGGVPERVQLLSEALGHFDIQAIPIWDDVETDPVALGGSELVRAVTEHSEATAVIGR